VSFVPREERARRSRQAQFANGQRPGGSDVDPRQRRSSEAELQTSQRVGDGQEVDANGRAQVRKDKTIEVDSRNRHRVAADNLRFATPVDGSQAATKDYVDGAIDSIVTGSAWQSVSKLPEARTNLGGTGYVVVDQSSNFHYLGAFADLDNLAGVGPNGLQLATGYYWVLRQQVIVGNSSGGTRTVQVRLQQDQGGSIITLTMFSTDIGNGAVRTINLETISSGGDDVYLEVGATSATNAGIVIDSARLHAQLLELRNDPDIAGSLPPPLGITASFSAESLTAVAWTDDVAFLQTSVGDADTFTWTFDEWGPTYLTYSGAYGSLVSNRFMDGGTHTVQLTASGPSGSDTATVDVVVQDVVETQNILASVGILDATGFDDLPANVASQSVSSIAAPDGTLTAIETVATSPTVQPVIRALLFKTTGTYTQIGDLWQDGLAWTCAIYAYMGQANAERITLQVRTLTTAGVSSDVVTVVVVDGSVLSFSSNSTGSVAYSAERNARVEAVGDTGWYRIEVTLQDYARTCDRIYLEIYGTSSSAYDRYITWNPTLRYGDWVSRGKNWGASDPRDFAFTPDTALSSIVAPDGTLSAVDITYTSSPYQGIWREQITAGIPGSGLYVWSFYIRETDYATGTAGLNENRLNLRFELFVGSTPVVSRRSDLNLLSGSVALDSPANFTVANIEAVGSDGWHKVTVGYSYDGSSGAISTAYIGIYHPYLPNPTQTHTVWNPRLTVGNPADMLDYFVSGPQNLLGDGSDYSGWTAGVH
jgi:hypothetical protein